MQTRDTGKSCVMELLYHGGLRNKLLLQLTATLQLLYTKQVMNVFGIWLRSLINHILGASGYELITKPTPLFEDNAACIEQIKLGFIKGDRTKHIAPKFFFNSELRGIDIDVSIIRKYCRYFH